MLLHIRHLAEYLNVLVRCLTMSILKSHSDVIALPGMWSNSRGTSKALRIKSTNVSVKDSLVPNATFKITRCSRSIRVFSSVLFCKSSMMSFSS